MITALDEWLERLGAIRLPLLPATRPALAQLLEDPNVRLSRLADVAEQDPGLVLHVLRTANAVPHRHLGTEVTTVEHALMMLGIARSQRLPDEIPPLKKLTAASRQGLLRSYGRTFHAAYQAWDWARARHDTEPGEVLLAALLHPLAEMLLWLAAPEKMEELERHRAQVAVETDEAEYVVFGFGFDQLSLRLAERWRLPGLLRRGLQAENAESGRVQGILLATQLALEAERGWYRPAVDHLIEQIAEHLKSDFPDTANRVHRTAARAARLTAFYGVPHPAALLLAPVAPQRKAAEVAGEAAEFCLTPRLDLLRQIEEELRSLPRPCPAQQIMDITVRGMHSGLGLNRVVFAMLTPDHTGLRALAVAGSEADPAFSRFCIDLEEDNLFQRLMQKPQAVWMSEDNRARLWPLVPEAFRHAVRTFSFFAMSVFVGGRPVGLFYADRHTSACRLDGASYERFKSLASRAAALMDQGLARPSRADNERL